MPSTVRSASRPNPHIFSVNCVVPDFCYLQEEITEAFISALQMPPKLANWYQSLANNSLIKTRHSCIGDLALLAKNGLFLGCQLPQNPPNLTVRNGYFKKEAPQLAKKAVEGAIKKWGGSPQEITHVISVSCTGMMAPGLEVELIDAFALNPTVERVGLNFMGCFGAIRGLAVAKAIAAEDPKHRVLLITTELCSLHFDHSNRPDALLGNALFGDGAAAAIIGIANDLENPLWEMMRTASCLCKNSRDEMSWDIGEHALEMRLTREVPKKIAGEIRLFSERLLGHDTSHSECTFAIHPGGRAILEGIENMLALRREQTYASWEVLANFGNMSSPTFLFVLDRLTADPNQWTAGLAFGPGLGLEGLLLKKVK